MIQDILKFYPTKKQYLICDGCKLNLPDNKYALEICDDDLVNLLLCRECVAEIARFANENVHLITPSY